MSVRILLALGLFVLTGFAPAPFPKSQRQREDPNDLTGTWAFTAIAINGDPSGTDFSNFRIEMTKDKIIFHTERRSEWKLVLDPTASPPAFTWCTDEGHVNYAGIYRLRDGELTMVYTLTPNPAERPTSFEGGPYKYVFRRLHR